ncbi:serine hydrolase [Candidatus Bathyarchaeota archaeon]|nr:serine hydrolase [Candidatus Bathyarchaeota archaeon]
MNTSELINWIEENIPDYMREGKLPGYSLAVLKDGETIYSGGFGVRDRQKGLPATPDTLYGIGSITKSFVAIGIMQLVEEGELSIDDPVKDHLPLNIGFEGETIKIHHLLTHSLGLPSIASSSVALYRGVGEDTGIPFGGVKDFYRLVNGAKDELVAKPGERFFYHNAAWRMLGHIIQEKSDMPFHHYIKKKILSPLGMERSTLNSEEFRNDSNRIIPYWKKPDGSVEPSNWPYPNPEENPEFSFIAAAGGIASTVNEMTKYMKMHLSMGEYFGGRLASRDSFSKIQTMHIKRPEGYYGETGYGYGLSVTPDFLGHKMIGHGGSILVSTAYMAMIPDINAGVIMMGNSAKIPYEEIAESIFAILMDKKPEDVIPPLEIKSKMNRLVGKYKTYKGIENVEVKKRGGMLYVHTKNPFTDMTQPIIPEDSKLNSLDFYIYMDGCKTPVKFHLKDDGGVDLYIERYVYHKN